MKKFTYNISTLPSGLRLLHIPFTEAASVYITMLGRVGRRAELPAEIGAAHFLEHLFFDGTPTRPDSGAIAYFLDSLGVRHNGVTSTSTVEYYTRSLPEYAPRCMEFLGDIFTHSLLREEDIEKERRVIKEEAADRHGNPDFLMAKTFLANMFPGNALGRTIADEEHNLDAMSRDLLVCYRDRNYVGENFVLCVAGNISTEEATRLATAHFATLPNGSSNTFETPQLPTSLLAFAHQTGVQSKLRIAFRSYPSFTQESNVADVLGYILGGPLSSRLYRRLREDLHLVYSIGSGESSYTDLGYFTIGTQLQEKNLQQVIDAIAEVVQGVLRDGVTDAELDAAKASVRTDAAFGLEKVTSHADIAANYLLWKGQVPQPHDELRKIYDITKEDVLHVAHYIFSDTPKVVAVTEKTETLSIPSFV